MFSVQRRNNSFVQVKYLGFGKVMVFICNAWIKFTSVYILDLFVWRNLIWTKLISCKNIEVAWRFIWDNSTIHLHQQYASHSKFKKIENVRYKQILIHFQLYFLLQQFSTPHALPFFHDFMLWLSASSKFTNLFEFDKFGWNFIRILQILRMWFRFFCAAVDRHRNVPTNRTCKTGWP